MLGEEKFFTTDVLKSDIIEENIKAINAMLLGEDYLCGKRLSKQRWSLKGTC